MNCRRCFQFSLRSFIIAVTGLCVWLAYRTQAVTRENGSLKVLAERADFLYSDEFDPEELEVWDLINARPWHPKGWYETVMPFNERVVAVRFRTFVNAEVLNALANLPSLRGLIVHTHDFDDDCLQKIGNLTRLEYLDLRGTWITDSGLETIGTFRDLRQLDLTVTHVSGSGLRHLRSLKKLKRLRLKQTKVTDHHVAVLGELHQLRSLDLWPTRVTIHGVQGLRKQLPTCRLFWGDSANKNPIQLD